jgi:phosphoribosyl 1,2-cyclic phosphodiesterase
MKGFCPLASGSKGNALFIGTGKTRVLIDAGLSARKLGELLGRIGVDPASIEGLFITHEHSDHIAGLSLFASRYKIPVLCNAETAKGIYQAIESSPRFKIFTTGETFHFGSLEVHPFSIPHDTLDPVGFTVKTGEMKIGICADLGHVTSLVKKHLEQVDLLYLEANHEPSMVHACARPQVYKERVLGKTGHLSNQQAAELLKQIAHPGMRHIYLAHLSSECNHPDLALKRISEALEEKNLSIPLSIAWQDRVSLPSLF